MRTKRGYSKLNLSIFALSAALLHMGPSLVWAGDQSTTVKMDNIPKMINNNAEMEALPLSAVIAVEKNGTVMFMSENGRFLFTGEVLDKWSGKTVKTLEDARRVANYADFDQINFKPEMLEPYVIGSGPKVVSIFVDPLCQYCAKVLNELPIDDKSYTFQIIPVGLLGQDSIQAVKSLVCAVDENEAIKALLKKSYSGLSQRDDCKPDLLAKRLLAAQLIGVNGVPYTIRHDGLIGKGYPPEGYAAWLSK